MKEEEIEKGDCGPPTQKVFFFFFFFFFFLRIEGGPVVYPANAFDSRLRGDWEPLGSSPTKSQKKDLQSLKGSFHFSGLALLCIFSSIFLLRLFNQLKQLHWYKGVGLVVCVCFFIFFFVDLSWVVEVLN